VDDVDEPDPDDEDDDNIYDDDFDDNFFNNDDSDDHVNFCFMMNLTKKTILLMMAILLTNR